MSESAFVTYIDNLPPDRWDRWIAAHPTGHLLQSWQWGEFKARFGWQPVRVALERGGEIVAAAQILLRRLPLGKMAYIPKGPVLDREDIQTSAALQALCRRALAPHQPVSLKIEPDWPDSDEARMWCRQLGYRQSAETIQPQHTILVDLTPDEEQILGAMKPKTRYNIRLAARKGVIVRQGDERDLEAFYRLMEVTGQRDRFAIHSHAYYDEVYRRFAAQGRVALLMAEYEGKLLASLMAFAFGEKAWYMYGASSDDDRHLMPNHLLQWEAMRWARNKGCRTYDLWGIPDLEIATLEDSVKEGRTPDAAESPLYGVYRFKRGFGGEPVRYVGAYDQVYRPLLYRLLTWAWQQRRGSER